MTNQTTGENKTAAALMAQIREHGPITVAEFMQAAAEAYYGKGDVFGADGDFITSPEISQVFGELVGLWCAVVWQKMGQPKPVRLIECGPGRGTLMADALRAAGRIPNFPNSTSIHLVEKSAALQKIQEHALKDHSVSWHSDIQSCPAGPAIVIANEFLDALPIKQFLRMSDGWRERCVSIDASGALAFTTSSEPSASELCPADAITGEIFEYSPAVEDFVGEIADRIVAQGGAALFIDYGHKISATGETLQAVKHHKPHPVLSNPGNADLTAHVDFELVAKSAQAKGARVFGPIEQGTWLSRLGIKVRGAQLSSGKDDKIAQAVLAGVRRLTEPDAMGALFKVLAISHPDLTDLEGF